MTANEARTLLRYSAWASRRVLTAAQQLTPEQLTQPNGISHDSIAGTLSHIYWADRAWYQRIQNPEQALPSPSSWEETAIAWPQLLDAWQTWTDKLNDGDLDQDIHYKSLAGTPASTRLDHIVMHVVNHATLHRGQVMGMIRQLGVQPPATDMIYYFREQSAAAS